MLLDIQRDLHWVDGHVIKQGKRSVDVLNGSYGYDNTAKLTYIVQDGIYHVPMKTVRLIETETLEESQFVLGQIRKAQEGSVFIKMPDLKELFPHLGNCPLYLFPEDDVNRLSYKDISLKELLCCLVEEELSAECEVYDMFYSEGMACLKRFKHKEILVSHRSARAALKEVGYNCSSR